MSEQQRIDELEKDMLGVSYRLDAQGEVLREIRDVLVQQSQILQNVTAIRESINRVKDDVDRLEVTFEKRKETTDENNKTFLEFVNRAKGALVVCALIFGLVQTIVYDSFNDNQATHKELQLEIKQMQKQITVLEAAKPQQKAPVASE